MSLVIDRITELTPYEQFYARYLKGNLPCILSSAFTANWPCVLHWISTDGRLLLDVLASSYGDADVPVVDCNAQSKYGSVHVSTEKFRDYLDYLRVKETRVGYLKDWHFQRQFPSAKVYDVPGYFSSDWLNEFCDAKGDDDYRFLYLGPAGSWTPLHEDVLQSFSWSANISGCKKWYLFPPGEEEKLQSNGQLCADVTKVDLTGLNHAVVIQNAGEIIFVPSRWHHQVHNVEDTLSINHNWINGANIKNTWHLLTSLLRKVEEEISDCRAGFCSESEWMAQCQKILKADVAMDFRDFKYLLEVILKNRNSRTSGGDGMRHSEQWLLDEDLSCVNGLLRELAGHPFFKDEK